MQSLYAIESEYQDLFAELENALANQDEMSTEQIDELLNRMDINRDELTAKAEAYAAKIKEKKARADYLKAEADRLQAMAKAELKTAEFLTDRITNALVNQGLNRIETDHFKLLTRTNTSVQFTGSVDDLPEAYKRVSVKAEPDKQSIKQALQAGMTVPGAELVEKVSIQIK